MPMCSTARKRVLPAMAASVVLLVAMPVHAQTATDSDGGRYKFSPTSDGGVLRLDTRTGSVSNCAKRDAAGWACYSVPDERDALDAEIGRLQAENTRLKDELKTRDVAEKKDDTPAQREKNNTPDAGKSDAGKGNRLELQLPGDQDIDRMVGVLERAWRRLVDAANRMQRDVQGKI